MDANNGNESPTSLATDMACKHPKRMSRTQHGNFQKKSRARKHDHTAPSSIVVEHPIHENDESFTMLPTEEGSKMGALEEVEENMEPVYDNKDLDDIDTFSPPSGASKVDGGRESLGSTICTDDGHVNQNTSHNSSNTRPGQWMDVANNLNSLIDTQTEENKRSTEVFLDSIDQKQRTTAELENVVQDCHRVMNESLQFLMQQVVVQVHTQYQGLLGDMEQDIVRTMTENHQCRTRLKRRIERAQQAYINQNGNLMARVDHPAILDDSNEGMGMFSPQRSPGDPSNEGEGVQDPDWDALVASHEPNREQIRLFLDARARKTQSEEALDVAMQQVHMVFKEQVVDAMIQSAIRIHEQCEHVLGEMEHDIQHHMFANHQRRQDFKQSLEECTKRAQGFFADALARLQGDTGNLGPNPEDVAGKHEFTPY